MSHHQLMILTPYSILQCFGSVEVHSGSNKANFSSVRGTCSIRSHWDDVGWISLTSVK